MVGGPRARAREGDPPVRRQPEAPEQQAGKPRARALSPGDNEPYRKGTTVSLGTKYTGCRRPPLPAFYSFLDACRASSRHLWPLPCSSVPWAKNRWPVGAPGMRPARLFFVAHWMPALQQRLSTSASVASTASSFLHRLMEGGHLVTAKINRVLISSGSRGGNQFKRAIARASPLL